MKSLDKITDMAALKRLLEKQNSGMSRTIDAVDMAAKLKERVKGQDHVVDDVSRFLKFQWAKEKRKRPIANMMFLGPTGTGKTELCKGLAEYLYGDEKAMLIFDCGDFSGPEGKSRLIGQPVGYVGSTQGGQLTRPMLNNPKRIVIFDEIEKAHPSIMDLFLSMMGDARLTEQGSGEAADFTQAIIILTSNAEQKALTQLQKEMGDDEAALINAIKSHLASTNKFRPEILGRLDKIYVYNPLTQEIRLEIINLKMQTLAKEYGLVLEEVSPELLLEALNRADKVATFGARALEQQLNDMFGEQFVLAKEGGGKHVRMVVADDGKTPIIEPAVMGQGEVETSSRA